MSVLIVSFVVAALTADGASVYRENCAACHGKEGHGDGPTAPELKYKPRDFREGKFAFGNTPGAMVKTVMSGIPGELQARMPAFKSVLAAEEIDAVVAYVRTMMPVEPAPTPTDMKLEPRDGALMVRGILPGLKEGAPPLARGLLVGLPSGFSFEYETDRVRLLAVRRGEFVSRTDWEERGGRPLTPLGSVVLATVSPPFTEFEISEGSGESMKTSPLLARLRSTSTKGGNAELVYDLFDIVHGKVRAHVKEKPRDVVVSDGAGIVQEFEITAPEPTTISFNIAFECDPKLAAADSHALKRRKSGEWSILHLSATSTIAVSFRFAGDGEFMPYSNDRIGLEGAFSLISAGPTPTTFKRILVARGPTTPDQIEKMNTETKELR